MDPSVRTFQTDPSFIKVGFLLLKALILHSRKLDPVNETLVYPKKEKRKRKSVNKQQATILEAAA